MMMIPITIITFDGHLLHYRHCDINCKPSTFKAHKDPMKETAKFPYKVVPTPELRCI